MIELYKKYRPTKWRHILGQDEIVEVLRDKLAKNKVPQAIGFFGASGVGKTTTARLLRKELGCGDLDFKEINCGDFRGIDTIRDIISVMGYRAMDGKCKVWLVDEVHQSLNLAQEAFLKVLEDTPPKVYFFLCTTDESKLIAPLKNRLTKFVFKLLKEKDMEKLLCYVLGKEKKSIPKEVFERIVEVAEGSPRRALVMLDQIIDLDKEEDQLNMILEEDSKILAHQLFGMLITPGTAWPEICKAVEKAQQEPETIRHIILACATNSILKARSKNRYTDRCFLIINAFEETFMYSKKAGLTRALYQVCTAK